MLGTWALFTVFILTLSADRAGAALLLPRLPEPGSRVLLRAWGGGTWFGGGGVLWVGPVCLHPGWRAALSAGLRVWLGSPTGPEPP